MTYKSVSCENPENRVLSIESSRLKVLFQPGRGGRIVSLKSKLTNKEFLWQAQSENCLTPFYGAKFKDCSPAGIDDMFPTILEEYSTSPFFKGVHLPDHGEVWARPWQVEGDNESIRMKIYGIALPYLLEKKIGFKDEHTLVLEYNLTNLCELEYSYLWAFHPLFDSSEKVSVILPPSVTHIINCNSESSRLGAYGTVHSWSIGNFNRQKPSEDDPWSEKFYVKDSMHEGWCALKFEDSGEIIRLSFDVNKVPYLGIWMCGGGGSAQNVALEPCTGAFDSPNLAQQWRKASFIEGYGRREWHVAITLTEE